MRLNSISEPKRITIRNGNTVEIGGGLTWIPAAPMDILFYLMWRLFAILFYTMALCDDTVVYISPSYSTTKICQLNTPNKTNENNENKINKIRIHRFQEPYKLHVYTYMPWVKYLRRFRQGVKWLRLWFRLLLMMPKYSAQCYNQLYPENCHQYT